VLDAMVYRWPFIEDLFGDAAYGRDTLLDKAIFSTLRSMLCGACSRMIFAVRPRR
jgi:hypothetical protein